MKRSMRWLAFCGAGVFAAVAGLAALRACIEPANVLALVDLLSFCR